MDKQEDCAANRGNVEAPANILIVDKDPEQRRVMTHVAKTQGYRVSTAVDGETALKIISGNPPDLVLLELILPGIDGFKLCCEIRKISAVPIIIVTSIDGELDRVAGLRSGADDYVVKPFSLAELGARMRAVLRRSSSSSKSA
jgi:DNA-binding response OmpR family regulator